METTRESARGSTPYLVAASPAFGALSLVVLVCTVGAMALLGPGLAGGLFAVVVTLLGVGAVLVFAALPLGMYLDAVRADHHPGVAGPTDAAKRGATGLGAFLLVATAGWLLSGPLVATLVAVLAGCVVASGTAVSYLRARPATV